MVPLICRGILSAALISTICLPIILLIAFFLLIIQTMAFSCVWMHRSEKKINWLSLILWYQAAIETNGSCPKNRSTKPLPYIRIHASCVNIGFLTSTRSGSLTVTTLEPLSQLCPLITLGLGGRHVRCDFPLTPGLTWGVLIMIQIGSFEEAPKKLCLIFLLNTSINISSHSPEIHSWKVTKLLSQNLSTYYPSPSPSFTQTIRAITSCMQLRLFHWLVVTIQTNMWY